MTHSNRVENIVIVGGGSAGWLTAGLLAAEFHNSSNHNFSVTLVESPEIKTLGVGEGTWPTMRETLRRIGVSENEFLVKCSASFKQASKFVNWRTENGNDSYYHPFMLPQGFSQTDVAGTWQSLSPDKGFARTVTPQPVICDLNLAPKQLATPEYAGVLNYGYHLDAGKFSEFLKDHCTNKLGVN